MSETLEAFNVAGEHVRDRLTLAADALNKAGYLTRSVIDVFHMDGIVFEFHIQGNLDLAIAAEETIQETIASSEYSPADVCVSFHCVTYECQAN